MVAIKYANALIKSITKNKIEEIYNALAKLSAISKHPKFIMIVKSPLLSVEDKVKFLSELTSCNDEKFKNFLKIILINKRVDLLKEIFNAFNNETAKILNTYQAFVEGKIDKERLTEIENKLSQKFDANIKVILKEKDINGLRIFVDVLNVEMALVEDAIKRDLINTILKGV